MTTSVSKTALVTGGSRGIGRAICEVLHGCGYNILFTFRQNQGAAEELLSSLNNSTSKNIIEAYQCDMADLAAVTTLINQLKEKEYNIDALVNNAGRLGETKQFLMSNDAMWFQTLRDNVACVTNVCRRILPMMINNRVGRIINITSIAARMGNPGQSAYAASKAAIIAYSKSLFREVSSLGITINCVSPGLVSTEMTDQLNKRYVEELLKVPLRRMASPEEIAQVVRFLVVDAPDYMLGQDLVIDGGLGL